MSADRPPRNSSSPTQAGNDHPLGRVSTTTNQSNNNDRTLYSIRLVPHLDATRSLHFEPIERKIASASSLKIGRFTDRGLAPGSNQTEGRIAFKSKVVSRGHADIFTDSSGSFFIKDTKSSSGTFLNHVRLSAPGGESKPFPLRDGDVLQLGVDYQGGTEEIYRCVKMKVELNRGWQRSANTFNRQALAQLRALGQASKQTATPTSAPAGTVQPKPSGEPLKAVSDCCICLFGVTVCQALFIAPCSHTYHYKCIRPLLQMHHPGFSCPLCRAFADLEADVETEELTPKSPTVESVMARISTELPSVPETQPDASATPLNHGQTPSGELRSATDGAMFRVPRPETLWHPMSSSMDLQPTAVETSPSQSPDATIGETNRLGDATMLDPPGVTLRGTRSPVLLPTVGPSHSGVMIEAMDDRERKRKTQQDQRSGRERRSSSIGSLNCSTEAERPGSLGNRSKTEDETRVRVGSHPFGG